MRKMISLKNILYMSDLIPSGSISSVQFFIKGNKEVKSASKVRITNPKSSARRKAFKGGISDPHLGTTENWRCSTCKNGKDKCPGHYGELKLNYPVIQPFFEKYAYMWTKLICFKCGNFAFEVNSALHYEPKREIMKRYLKQPKINDGGICVHCGETKYKVIWKKDEPTFKIFYVKAKKEYVIFPHELKQYFKKVELHTVILLGKNEATHPKKLVISRLTISPTVIRPERKKIGSSRTGNFITSIALQEIVRINSNLPETIPTSIAGDYLIKIRELNGLVYDMIRKGVNTTKFRSAIGKQKSIISITAGIPGKEGQIRKHIFGKKVEGMIRGVITCNTNIRNNEIGIPENLAHKIQIRETVRPYNIDRLMVHFRNGTKRYPGATTYIKSGKLYSIISNDTLEIGYEIFRDLIDGDRINFNRQPSFTTSSIMCHIVRIMPPGNTIDINPNICNCYHADFDGDNMNVQIPRTIPAMAEIGILCDTSRCFVSSGTGNPQIGQIQEAIIGLFELTSDIRLSQEKAMRLFAGLQVYPVLDAETYSGHELLTKLFEYNNIKINYRKMPSYYIEGFKDIFDYPKNLELVIENGVFKSGFLDKKSLSFDPNTIYHIISNSYSAEKAIDMIYQMQQMALSFLMITGFTMSLSDIDLMDSVVTKIFEAESKILEKVAFLNQKLIDGKIVAPLGTNIVDFYEILMLKSLELGDDTIKPIIEGLDISNSFLKMIMIGARGKMENFRSSLSSIGQLQIEGRIEPTMAHRTCATFPRYSLDPTSRGFTVNSYRSGMSQEEFFFHAMESRVSLIRIQLQTPIAGTENRKSIKNFDSSIVDNYRRVMNGNKVVQLIAGGTGSNPQCLEKIKCPIADASLSNAEFEKRYKFSSKDTQYALKLDAEFKQLQEDRDFFRNKKLQFEYDTDDFFENTFYIPVPLVQLLEHIESIDTTDNKSKSSKKVKEEVEYQQAEECLDIVNSYLKNVEKVFFNPTVEFEIAQPYISALRTFKIIIRSWLNTYTFTNKRMNPKSLKIMLEKLELHHKSNLIEYGTAIGVITAQSVSWPLTQSALDSKHTSGLNVKKRSLKQFQEVVSAATIDKQMYPSMTLRVYREKEEDQVYIKSVANKIEMMNLKMFILSYYIVPETLTKLHPLFTSHKLIVDEFIQLNTSIKIPNDLLKFSIVFIINKITLIQKNMSIVELYTKLQLAFPNLFFVYSLETHKEQFIRVYFKGSQLNVVNLTKKYLISIKDKILEYTIRGITGIKKADVFERIKNYCNPEGIIEKHKIYEIITEGTNFAGIMDIDELDLLRCLTNNIQETNSIFGIHITKRKIACELKRQVSEILNIYSDLYSENMTLSGKLTGISGLGLSSKEYKNILLRLSESDPLSVITSACENSITDHLNSLSAYTLMGQTPKSGSNYNELVLYDLEDNLDIIDQL